VELAVSISTLVASLVLLLSGRRRLEFGSFPATALTFLELLGLGLAVVSLGWWGLGALGIVNFIAALVWSVVLAAKVESKLVYAAIQAGVSKGDMKELAKRLGRAKELKIMGPLERAELIRLLADRNRKLAEIESMAVPIGMLKTIHSAPLPWLVESFDRLLRLTNEPPDKSTEVADTLHGTAQNAAASFEEIVNSFLLFYGGEDAVPDQAEAETASVD
jgi:ABC-type transporter Mla MlaB component